MMKSIFVLFAVFTVPANAEVFKCQLANGSVEYRPTPCAGIASQRVDIKPPSDKEQQLAEEKLRAWQMKEALNENKVRQAEKQRQSALNQERHLQALEKQVQATQNLSHAIEEQNRIGEIEHQNRLNRYNSMYIADHHYSDPAHSDRTDDDHRYRHGHDGRHDRRHDENLEHKQLGDYGLYRPQGSVGGRLGEYGPVPSP